MSMCNNKFVIICFDSNSQTSEPIRSPKSPTVDLEVEEQEGSQGSPGIEEEREQEPTNEDLDTSKKKKDNLRCLGSFYKEESWRKN